ncbi:hypothetical protein JKP88DRAFT_277120 [Tribonema minus]|uniref:Uncharacterized protein n=1 Tax=Tribonema minus TaxID=303371 RepID=A0A835Z0V6_9STRA|nr:hypothetical protein JKP88DRAFT_277120 [Tribonema minus]
MRATLVPLLLFLLGLGSSTSYLLSPPPPACHRPHRLQCQRHFHARLIAAAAEPPGGGRDDDGGSAMKQMEARLLAAIGDAQQDLKNKMATKDDSDMSTEGVLARLFSGALVEADWQVQYVDLPLATGQQEGVLVRRASVKNQASIQWDAIIAEMHVRAATIHATPCRVCGTSVGGASSGADASAPAAREVLTWRAAVTTDYMKAVKEVAAGGEETKWVNADARKQRDALLQCADYTPVFVIGGPARDRWARQAAEAHGFVFVECDDPSPCRVYGLDKL